MNNVKSLNELIAEVTEAVKEAYNAGFTKGAEAERAVYRRQPIVKFGHEIRPTVIPMLRSTQEMRDDTIEKAKRDVADLTQFARQGLRRNFPAKMKYFINRDSGVVVAIASIDRPGTFLNNGMLGKGIAKCAPDDCFNVHIGKAIALRRALGLEVPAEYLSVPQPTEVRVGDLTNINGHKVTIYVDRYAQSVNELIRSGIARVVDDSREEVAK